MNRPSHSTWANQTIASQEVKDGKGILGVGVLVYLSLRRGLHHPISRAESRPDGFGKLPLLEHMDGHCHREHVRHLPQMEGEG
jgi:hypothetical protein